MKLHDATLDGFIAGLQFKMGQIAGDATQIVDMSTDELDDDVVFIRTHAQRIVDLAMYVNGALGEVKL